MTASPSVRPPDQPGTSDVLDAIERLRQHVDARIDGLRQHVDERIDTLEARIDTLDTRIDKLEAGQRQLELAQAVTAGRLDAVDKRIGDLVSRTPTLLGIGGVMLALNSGIVAVAALIVILIRSL